jgi:hypothetical protein
MGRRNGPFLEINVRLDKNFKLSKTIKRQMAMMDSSKKTIYKNMMIDAQISASSSSKSHSRNKKAAEE